MTSTTTAPTVSAPSVSGPSVSAPPASATVEALRRRIDDLDAEIVRLVRERSAVSADVQRARQAAGGPRIAQARENEIVGRWAGELGRPGGTIALALLELGRGRPS